MEPAKSLGGLVTPLPRGGFLVDTPEGYVQFGSPPETIKDTMALPKSVPQVFVLPRALFDWRKGINLADLEFPIYYNFFFQKRKTRIVCTRTQASRLMRALQEALFGPRELMIESDVFESDGFVPDIRKEMDYFRGPIRFRDVLSLSLFDGGRYELGGVSIRIDPAGDFDVYFDSKKLAHIPGIIPCKPMHQIGKRLPEPYKPPLFGVTCLGPSHGFDPTANTSGFIIWLNHSGIMIDPPINSTEWLESSNVNPKLIDSIILTHCHADHDAGTLQKILEEGKITVYSTKTVMRSFLKKYSSLTGEPVSNLIRLFNFRPVYIGKPVFIHGGRFRFYYTLHSIPTIGFTLKFQDQSFVYSSDHQADPEVQDKLVREGVMDGERFRQLRNFPWDSKVVYHESGIAPLHTPIAYLNSLPRNVQKKTVVYHIAKKDFPRSTALTLASFGIENTLYFKTRPPAYERTYEILDVLKHLDFVESLTVEKIQEFVTIIDERRVEKGHHIIRKGEEGKSFFIIRSGNVSIRDEELIGHKFLGTYEYFGEVALLSEVPRTADVVAETDVNLYTVEKDKFLSFIYGTQFEKTLRRLVANRSSETWNIMASSPTLQHLTSYQRTWLESILVPKEHEGPGVLVKEGKSLEQFFIIREGQVEVNRNGQLAATLGKGDCIGAMHKIYGDEISEFTVSHKKAVKLFGIDRQDVLDFVEGNPGVGMKLTYQYTLRD
ncbi:MAG: cAMP/cGMP-dependent 3',5'-cyclic-AMP/GMP phosphodiesterase [Spirochaetales bacterium]|nr:cAMP/cGMP-dependent 3',5'-cyclic-AMP/GMP phosphodiesterase [Spirochaetales bacterium]